MRRRGKGLAEAPAIPRRAAITISAATAPRN